MRKLIVAFMALRAWATLLLRSPGQIKYLVRWLSSILARWRRGGQLWDHDPWLVFAARDRLDTLITRDAKVFEWGSGISTVWLARRAALVVSVEHDPAWYEAVGEALAERGLKNCKRTLVERGPGADDVAWEAYASLIDAFDDGYFDVVVVDGRARVQCAAHAAAKVAEDGALLLDNAERPRYRAIFERLAAWDRVDFDGPGPYLRSFWQTTIWRRPVEP